MTKNSEKSEGKIARTRDVQSTIRTVQSKDEEKMYMTIEKMLNTKRQEIIDTKIIEAYRKRLIL